MSERLLNFWLRVLVCAVIVATVFAAVPTPKDKSDLAGSTVMLSMPNDRGHGSGVYIGNGVILTAAHVAETPNLEMVSDKGERTPVTLLWLNKDYDIAAVAVRPDVKVQVAEVSCKLPHKGLELTFSGNPQEYNWITMYGTVAGKPLQALPNWKFVTPVSAPIIPGMSGGPAFDPQGRVIGINVGVSVSHIGMYGVTFNGLGFIVPTRVFCLMTGRREHYWYQRHA